MMSADWSSHFNSSTMRTGSQYYNTHEPLPLWREEAVGESCGRFPLPPCRWDQNTATQRCVQVLMILQDFLLVEKTVVIITIYLHLKRRVPHVDSV